LSLRRDNGGQPTAIACIGACATVERHQACTSANNPEGNADTERVIRTLTAECRWRREWRCPLALVQALETWITADNEPSLHSALGDKPPLPGEREYPSRHSPPFAAA
jgi:hypothetical protein